jgi:hypothetical protein
MKVEVELTPVTFKMLYIVDVAAVKLAALLMEKMLPGVEVPTPKFPAAVRCNPSVKMPPLSVAKQRSPLLVEVPLEPPWKMPYMDDVVVPVLLVASWVRKASETLVPVAEERLVRKRGVVEAAELSTTSSLAEGEVVPMPTLPVLLLYWLEPELVQVELRTPLVMERPVPVKEEKTDVPRARDGTVRPPKKVEVAVEEVAMK